MREREREREREGGREGGSERKSKQTKTSDDDRVLEGWEGSSGLRTRS
jgi:hypothetical protein